MSSCDVDDRRVRDGDVDACCARDGDVDVCCARDGDVDACCARDGSSVYNITKVILNSRIANKNI